MPRGRSIDLPRVELGILVIRKTQDVMDYLLVEAAAPPAEAAAAVASAAEPS